MNELAKAAFRGYIDIVRLCRAIPIGYIEAAHGTHRVRMCRDNCGAFKINWAAAGGHINRDTHGALLLSIGI